METELKFQIPAQQRAAIHAALATARSRSVRLQARYFDTPDARLAGAGLALRLRREGGAWVQTLKGRGDGVLQRLEHEVVLLPQRRAPELDLERHDATAAGERLRRVLDQAAKTAKAVKAPKPAQATLVERFATDIRRTLRRVRSGGATIEIALDVGWLKAGGRRQAVHEIEFELIDGPPQALPPLAARWARRFGLWWDVRTKAERGQRLAEGTDAVSAVTAARVALAGSESPPAAFAAMVLGSLAHALPNLAEIADRRGSPEHLHQARVGLRRLRAVLRECAAWSADEAAARALEEAWRGPFGRLGAARDLDVMARTVLPQLQALGGPLPPMPPVAKARRAADAALHAEVTGAELQGLLLRTLALAAAAAPPAEDPRCAVLRRAAPPVLQRCARRALAGAARFHRLDEAQQHRVRKRLKRLRYLFEFLQPLYRGRAVLRLRKALSAAADSLGEMNDLAAAAAAFGPRWPAQALAALDAQRQRAVLRAGRQLRSLRGMRRPWRD